MAAPAPAPAPQPPRQKLDFAGRNNFAPVQRSLADIPVIDFDFAVPGGEHYMDVMERRAVRGRAIAPALFHGCIITPTDNPQNQRVDPVSGERIKETGSSHHIIRCTFSSQHDDETLAADLLVNDASGYMTAKRVRRNDVWGGWQQFTDVEGIEVPAFLNAEIVDIEGGHDRTVTMGGAECMNAIFYGLVAPVEDKKASQLAVRRAILLFCEAYRLRSVFLELFQRLVMNGGALPLLWILWDRIGSWKVLSRFLLEWAKYGIRVEPELEAMLPLYGKNYGLSSFQELIDEVLVLRYSDKHLLTSKVKKTLAFKKAGLGITDPRFT